jgi:23S rRNA pseudouridine1911/1915/1917 synthase
MPLFLISFTIQKIKTAIHHCLLIRTKCAKIIPMRYYSFRVTEDESGERLDSYLAELLPFSRSFIAASIKRGRALLDGAMVKPAHRLDEGQLVEIYIEPPVEPFLSPSPILLDIIFEDEDLIVVNKKAGISVHPGAGDEKDTLISAVLYHTKIQTQSGWPLRPGIVHRLDKDTSGVMVVAKSEIAYQSLIVQFGERQVAKEYLAICQGILPQDRGIIDLPIGRNRRHRQLMAVYPGASKPAITEYQVQQFFPPGATLVLARPKTGRTHQIRVHLAHIGYPVLGDKQYGGSTKLIGRQALHAQYLAFLHPRSSLKVEFRAPLPEDINSLINLLSEEK